MVYCPFHQVPLHNRLTNQLEASREALACHRASCRREELSRAQALVPILLHLVHWTDDQRTALALDLPGE